MSFPKVLYVIWFIYLAPIAIHIGDVGGKPIDFALSDFLIVFVPFIILASDNISSRIWAALSFLGYFPLIGMIGTIGSGGDIGNVLSAATFSMPFIHLLIGAYLLHRWGIKVFYPVPLVATSIIFCIFASDIVLGYFPRGCGTEGRWGGCFFTLDVYGFVNSSSAYLSVLGGALAASLSFIKRIKNRLFILSGIAALIFIIPMSLSRSSTLALAIIVFFWIFSVSKTVAFFFFILFGFTVSTLLPFLGDTIIGKGIANRVNAGFDHGDIASGRFGIWHDTAELISESPVIGYKFSYFSNVSSFGTAHNQYLEVLFKSGIIGFILYFGFIFYNINRTRIIIEHYNLGTRFLISVIGMYLVIMVNNISQPFTNYSVVANLMFMCFGILLTIPIKGRQ